VLVTSERYKSGGGGRGDRAAWHVAERDSYPWVLRDITARRTASRLCSVCDVDWGHWGPEQER
jgi:hypothetical protein